MREMGSYKVFTQDECDTDYGIPGPLVDLIRQTAVEMQPFLTDNIGAQTVLKITLGFLNKHVENLFDPKTVEKRAEIIKDVMRQKGLGDHAEENAAEYLNQQEGARGAAMQLVAAICVIGDSIEWADTEKMAEHAAEIVLADGGLPATWRQDLADNFPPKLAARLVKMLQDKGLAE